jgi:parallel beta-helix repeat protein
MQHVTNSSLLKRLPGTSADSVFQIDLVSIGITRSSEIQKRGSPGVELFFNNRRMTPARWPNEGWALIADVPQSGNLVYKGELPHMRFGMPVGKHYGRFTYSEERPKYWSNIGDIVLHGYWVWDWFDEYLKIESIDTASKEITIKAPHSNYGYCKQQRYYALNVLEELDRPGEWYIDRSQNTVLFWPPSDPYSSDLVISQLQEPLIQLDSCSNVRIEGFDLEYSQGNGIVINGGENNLVAGCTFSQLGDIAVRITGGKNNGLQFCDIKNVALGGVVLAGGNRKSLEAGKNFVVNCHIHEIGEWIRTYQSAITISGVGNYIAHNNIHDGPGTGILLTGNEHLLEYNELHHLALETGDVGAFYMGRDWTERGNIIRYNYFHDLTGPGAHDVNAVYLDDWASGTTVQGNIFSNCARGIMIGGGRDNTVDNNLFIDCRPAIHVDSRGLGWAKYYFDGTNKTLFDRMDSMNYTRAPYALRYPELLSLYNDQPAIAKNNVITHNISYLGRWMDLHDGLTFETVNSQQNLVADAEAGPISEKDKRIKGNPGITDYQQQDFIIKPAGLKNGYKNIQWSKIGLQRDPFRK